MLRQDSKKKGRSFHDHLLSKHLAGSGYLAGLCIALGSASEAAHHVHMLYLWCDGSRSWEEVIGKSSFVTSQNDMTPNNWMFIFQRSCVSRDSGTVDSVGIYLLF